MLVETFPSGIALPPSISALALTPKSQLVGFGNFAVDPELPQTGAADAGEAMLRLTLPVAELRAALAGRDGVELRAHAFDALGSASAPRRLWIRRGGAR